MGPEGLSLHAVLSFIDAEADGLLVQAVLDQQLEDGLQLVLCSNVKGVV